MPFKKKKMALNNYTGQSLTDRFHAVRHTLLGSGVGRGVCKATTEELAPPKKKHLNYLKQCTYEANISIPQLVELLIDRTRANSWIVTFKALITIHHLLNSGNERFGSCFASCGHKLNLSKFFDRSSLIELVNVMFPTDPENSSLRDWRWNTSDLFYNLFYIDQNLQLFRTLSIIGSPVDFLTDFTVSPSRNNSDQRSFVEQASRVDAMNVIVASAYRMLCKDCIRLYACYNDGVICMLERFFDLPKKDACEALDLYRRFLTRTNSLTKFLHAAEACGIDSSSFPDLTKAPSSLLETLENHISGLDETADKNDKNCVSISQNNFKSNRYFFKKKIVIFRTKFESDLIAFSNACGNVSLKIAGDSIDFNTEEKLMALEDEERAISKYNNIRKQSLQSIGSNNLSSALKSDNLPSLNNTLTRDLLDLDFGSDQQYVSKSDNSNGKNEIVKESTKGKNNQGYDSFIKSINNVYDSSSINTLPQSDFTQNNATLLGSFKYNNSQPALNQKVYSSNNPFNDFSSQEKSSFERSSSPSSDIISSTNADIGDRSINQLNSVIANSNPFKVDLLTGSPMKHEASNSQVKPDSSQHYKLQSNLTTNESFDWVN